MEYEGWGGESTAEGGPVVPGIGQKVLTVILDQHTGVIEKQYTGAGRSHAHLPVLTGWTELPRPQKDAVDPPGRPILPTAEVHPFALAALPGTGAYYHTPLCLSLMVNPDGTDLIASGRGYRLRLFYDWLRPLGLSVTDRRSTGCPR